jgi:hypothetical protein
MAKGKLAALVGIGLSVGFITVAFATSDPPFKANKLVANLVKSYDPCTVPNTMTSGGALAFPACQPAVQGGSSGCGFNTANKGFGKLIGKITGTPDAKFKVVAKGLTCPGTVLLPVATVRITTNNCAAGADCTSTDQVFPVPASCTVDSLGTCKISVGINDLIPGALLGGDDVDIEVLGCGLITQGDGFADLTFACGLHIQ